MVTEVVMRARALVEMKRAAGDEDCDDGGEGDAGDDKGSSTGDDNVFGVFGDHVKKLT